MKINTLTKTITAGILSALLVLTPVSDVFNMFAYRYVYAV